jgi:hypothetical protein
MSDDLAAFVQDAEKVQAFLKRARDFARDRENNGGPYYSVRLLALLDAREAQLAEKDATIVELQAALEITGVCRCTLDHYPSRTKGFECSRCKALALVKETPHAD